MYSVFALWIAGLLGALGGGLVGVILCVGYFRSEYEQGFYDGYGTADDNLFELEKKNEELERKLSVILAVSREFDGSVRDEISNRVSGSYKDMGLQAVPDGNGGVTFKRKVQRTGGLWRAEKEAQK